MAGRNLYNGSMVTNENLYQYKDAGIAEETKRYFWQSTGEALTVLFQNETVRIEKIVRYGQSTGGIEYKENVWLTVIEGEMTLENGDKVTSLIKGESCFIPAGRRHQIADSTNPCITLNVFFK